jgi:exonuclease VII small subunit
MSLVKELENYGVNTEDAMERFMNNVSLYERMLKKLPKTVKEMEVLKYLETGDDSTALTNAHTLKGVMGNLAITPLYDAYKEIVDLLRAGDVKKAESVCRNMIPVQEKIIACIENNS